MILWRCSSRHLDCHVGLRVKATSVWTSFTVSGRQFGLGTVLGLVVVVLLQIINRISVADACIRCSR